MLDPVSIVTAGVFLLAGFIKGVIGLGLPTVSMGLLALVMPPVEAAAILLVPSFVTNVWQMLAGPGLGALARRLWPMLLAACLGTWAGGWLLGLAHGRYGAAGLGIAIAIYGATGLARVSLSIAPRHQSWLGPAAGGLTGLMTAATGVFAIPAVPYLQAIGLEKEDLVQALGLSFTVSTLALAVDLASAQALDGSLAGRSIVALAMASIGMAAGQALRTRLHPATFRRWFFTGLGLLGLGIAGNALF